jgi:hypothetical protein
MMKRSGLSLDERVEQKVASGVIVTVIDDDHDQPSTIDEIV